ncbi:hypothetical protein DPMN_070162 [Dreissena polymorpha]|uniref:Uncharacterized protein n=1 Tax=Dreissena polymorpha TaxID=45954 RepID=A0A9D4BNP5_DREPO|nr:hypothetical protein DPMN_070162 [Dreissena polymorpha]
MEGSTEKSKVLVNSIINTSAEINMNDMKLEEITSFKNLGANLSKMVPVPLRSKKNYNGDHSDGQTEQVVDKQFHQLFPPKTDSTSPS